MTIATTHRCCRATGPFRIGTTLWGRIGLPSRLLGQQASVGQKASVRDHPVIGPNRGAVDVPASVKHLDRFGHPKATVFERFVEL